MGSKEMLAVLLILTFTLFMFHESFQYHPRIISEPEFFQSKEVVSLVYTIAGLKWTRFQFLTHLKSVFSHTSAALDLHIFVDETSNASLYTLLSTWKLPDVNFTLYDINEQIKEVSWIRNYHYSKVYGLMKIMIPSVIKRDKVIFLDADTLLRCDIRELSSFFQKMTNNQFIAMTENFGEYYMLDRPNVWPALGRGFNSGVILLDIKKLLQQNVNWDKLWRETLMKHLKHYKSVTLADQDIYNAIIYEHPSWVYKLHCAYNYQFKRMNICHHEPKIHHFNWPDKEFNVYEKSVASQEVTYLKMIRENITDFPVRTGCEVYIPSKNFVTFPFVLGNNSDEKELGVCVQLSADRLSHFLKMIEFWNHPISVAVYGSDDELKNVFDVLSNINRSDIAVHFVYKNSESIFPINFLRNVAIKYGNFKKVILIDADFILLGIYETLFEETMKLGKHEVLILPSFEFSSWNYLMEFSSKTLPMNKNETVEMLDDKMIRSFRSDIWPKGHNATNISKWKSSKNIYVIEWQPGYEPYIIIEKSTAPMFDERFGGFGWNKMAHILRIHHEKYVFKVASSTYLIHQNHQPSEGLETYRSNIEYKNCLKKLKNTVLLELKNKYY